MLDAQSSDGATLSLYTLGESVTLKMFCKGQTDAQSKAFMMLFIFHCCVNNKKSQV